MIQIQRAETAEEITQVRALWNEYWQSLGLPLTFQGFGEQLQRLPGEFAAPSGLLLLAMQQADAAGTIAVRPLADNGCEVKRLYVPARFRGSGLGRELLRTAIQWAAAQNYTVMYCDTLPGMQEAVRLYETVGFRHVAAYSPDPTPGAIYLQLDLHGAP